MARARKSHAGDEEKTNTGIEPAYSGKVGGNRYCLYCVRVRDEKVVNMIVWNFNAKHAAKWFMEKIIGNHTWIDGTYGMRPSFICDNGVIVSMPGEGALQEISDYVRSGAELDWHDPILEPYIRTFLYGQEGSHNRSPSPEVADEPGAHGGADVADEGREPERKRGRKRRVSDDRPQPARAARTDMAGLVTAVDLGNKLKLLPREVRGALRAIGAVKPVHGWAWSPKEAESIEAQVTAHLKKKGKK